MLKSTWIVLAALAVTVCAAVVFTTAGVCCGGVLLLRGSEQERTEAVAKQTIEQNECVMLKGVVLAKQSEYEWSGYYDTTDGRRGNVKVTGELVRWTGVKEAWKR